MWNVWFANNISSQAILEVSNFWRKLRNWARNRKIIPSYSPPTSPRRNWCCRTNLVPRVFSTLAAGLQTGQMAAAVEGRWPNEKEQYELQEVIGALFMLYYAKKVSLCVSDFIFLPRLWSYGRRSSCTVHSSQ